MRPTLIKIFLACSLTYIEEREKVPAFFHDPTLLDILNYNDQYKFQVITSDSLWVSAGISKEGTQNEINEIIRGCDMLILLYDVNIGEFTREEFYVALEQFQHTESMKPVVFPFIKANFKKQKSLRAGNRLTEKNNELDRARKFENFGKILKKLGHYSSREYTNVDGLHFLIICAISTYIKRNKNKK